MTAPMNQQAAEAIFGTLATNDSVGSMGDQITNQIVGSITGLDSGGVASLTDFANELMGRDVSLAARVARIEGKIAVGAEFFDDFNRGDNASALGNGWRQGGGGQGLGIYDQAAQLDRAALPGDGRRYAISPTGSSNDDVTVAAVIHPRGTPSNPSTSLFLRANDTMTEFVYVNMFAGRCYMGRGTRLGNTWTFRDWTSNLAKSYSNSSTIEFKAIGNKYQLSIDSVLIMEHEDISGYPIDSGHRTVGFALQTWTGVLQIPQYSGGLASFAVRSSVELSAVQTAQQTAVAAQTTATEAQQASAGVRQVAEQAQETAQAAQSSADVAYAASARWKDEFMVSSAGVILGKNEVDLGMVMDVPPGRVRRITRLIYGLSRNTGAMIIELKLVDQLRNESTLHTTTIPAGVREYVDNGIDVSVPDGNRIHCNVTAIGGDSSVLQCALIGVLL